MLSGASLVSRNWQQQRITCNLTAKQSGTTRNSRLMMAIGELTPIKLGIFIQLLAYAYNQQVHRSTWMTTYCLSLSRKPPGLTLLNLPIALLHDASQPIPVKLLSLPIWHGLLLMCTKKDKTLKAVRTPYKQYFDQSARSLPTFNPGNYKYVDGPPVLKPRPNE